MTFYYLPWYTEVHEANIRYIPFQGWFASPNEVLIANGWPPRQPRDSQHPMASLALRRLQAFQAPRTVPLQAPALFHTLPLPSIPEEEDTTQPTPTPPDIPLPSALPKRRSTFVVKLPIRAFDPNEAEDKFHSIKGVFGSLYNHLWSCDPTCSVLPCFPPEPKTTRYTQPVMGPTSPIDTYPTSLETLQQYLQDLDPSPTGSGTTCRIHLAHSLPFFELLSKLNGPDKSKNQTYSFSKEWKQDIARHISFYCYFRSHGIRKGHASKARAFSHDPTA